MISCPHGFVTFLTSPDPLKYASFKDRKYTWVDLVH